jgi:hypothetical protein
VTGRAFRAALGSLIAIAAITGPAAAVGLGPLDKAGVTDAPDKGFWLTLLNSEPKVQNFHLYALDVDWKPIDGVLILPAVPRLGPLRQRKVLAVIRGLKPGDVRVVRVCAEPEIQEGTIHARVCSKLSARRLAVLGHDTRPDTGSAGE